MNTHPTSERLLAAALDTLEGADREAVRAHTAHCERCAAEVARLADAHAEVVAALRAYAARPRPGRASDWAAIAPRVLGARRERSHPMIRLALGGMAALVALSVVAVGGTAAMAGEAPATAVARAVRQAITRVHDALRMLPAEDDPTATPLPTRPTVGPTAWVPTPTATTTPTAPAAAEPGASTDADDADEDSQKGTGRDGVAAGTPSTPVSGDAVTATPEPTASGAAPTATASSASPTPRATERPGRRRDRGRGTPAPSAPPRGGPEPGGTPRATDEPGRRPGGGRGADPIATPRPGGWPRPGGTPRATDEPGDPRGPGRPGPGGTPRSSEEPPGTPDPGRSGPGGRGGPRRPGAPPPGSPPPHETRLPSDPGSTPQATAPAGPTVGHTEPGSTPTSEAPGGAGRSGGEARRPPGGAHRP